MGVLAPGSAHARPSAQPPSTLAEIFRHACLQSGIQTFPHSKNFFFFLIFLGGPIGGPRGGGGGGGAKF